MDGQGEALASFSQGSRALVVEHGTTRPSGRNEKSIKWNPPVLVQSRPHPRPPSVPRPPASLATSPSMLHIRGHVVDVPPSPHGLHGHGCQRPPLLHWPLVVSHLIHHAHSFRRSPTQPKQPNCLLSTGPTPSSLFTIPLVSTLSTSIIFRISFQWIKDVFAEYVLVYLILLRWSFSVQLYLYHNI